MGFLGCIWKSVVDFLRLFFITFTYYACCLIFFSDQVMRNNGWDFARKTKNSYSGLIAKCQEKSSRWVPTFRWHCNVKTDL